MNFGNPGRPPASQDRSVVPMINVVFLLLIFFLMTASLTPPPPVEITPPLSRADLADRQPATLYIAADGTLAFGGLAGAEAMAALARQPQDAPLPVMADAAYPASDLARLLPDLAATGLREIRLLTVQP